MHLVKMLADLYLMITLVSFVHGQQCQLGAFCNSPHNQTVSPGEFVGINCHARGNSVGWHINGTVVRSTDQEHYTDFHFTYQQLSEREFNNTISFVAHPSHNNTVFECIIQARGQPHKTINATLIIAGSPLSPSISVTVEHLLNDTFMHTIHWEEPFTWENFPIISYELNITNHSLTIPDRETIQMSIPSNASNLTYSFNTNGHNCYGLNIALSASNSIGQSDSSTVHTGHPIAISEVTDMEINIVFQSNDSSHLSVRFQAPWMCPVYQYATYYITDLQLRNYGPTSFVQVSDVQVLIEREVEEEFQPLGRYQFEVTVISCGITQVLRKEFGDIGMMWCRNDSVVVANQTLLESETCKEQCTCRNVSAVIVNQTLDHEICKERCSGVSSDLSYYKFATIGVAVGCGLLACCCLTLVIVTMKLYRQLNKDKTQETDGPDSGNETVLRRRSTRNRPPTLRLESNNPIYEGVTYEVTPGESLKSLSIPPSTPSIELSSRYTFDVAPKLPPPRKSSVCFNTSSDFSSE